MRLIYKQGGIYIKPENKGKFNLTKNRTGKTTEELTHSKNSLTRKRAIFAQNASKWNKNKEGGMLNQGDKPMEFVLNKSNTKRDYTLDGYKIVNGKLEKDLKSSVSGYLRMIDDTKNMKQYGKNLYSKLKNGGYIK